MNFGQAVEALKQGKKVSRAGWNGKGMWIVRLEDVHIDIPMNDGKMLFTGLKPFICMKMADGMFIPWLASQTDILAEDWEEVA